MKEKREEQFFGDYEVRYWATEQSYKNGYADGYRAALKGLLNQLKGSVAISEEGKKEILADLAEKCRE